MRHRVVVAGAVIVLVLVGGAIVLAVGGGLDATTTERWTGGGMQVVEVALVDSHLWFDITPDVIEVDPGTELVIEVVNRADGAHDLEVGGLRTPLLAPGESAQLRIGPVNGDLPGRCTVGDHDAAGMTMNIRVTRE